MVEGTSKPKVASVAVQVEVPVFTCARCGKDSPCIPFFDQAPNGMTVVLVRPTLVPIQLGKESVFLCDVCFKFFRGAVVAMGIALPASQVS